MAKWIGVSGSFGEADGRSKERAVAKGKQEK